MSRVKEIIARRPLTSLDMRRIRKHMKATGLDVRSAEDCAIYRAEARNKFRAAHGIGSYSGPHIATWGPPQTARQARRVYGPEAYRFVARQWAAGKD